MAKNNLQCRQQANILISNFDIHSLTCVHLLQEHELVLEVGNPCKKFGCFFMKTKTVVMSCVFRAEFSRW